MKAEEEKLRLRENMVGDRAFGSRTQIFKGKAKIIHQSQRMILCIYDLRFASFASCESMYIFKD